VLASGPMSVMQASIVADWGDVTLFSNDAIVLDEAAQLLVRRRNIKLEPVPVVAIEGATPAIEALRLADGRLVPLRALFIAAPMTQTSPLAAQLGCAFDDTPLGPIVRTDAWKLTSVPGVYAAGDAARFPHSVTLASADGATAGIGAHHSLIEEEIGAA
jgi:thioredoxin reductase